MSRTTASTIGSEKLRERFQHDVDWKRGAIPSSGDGIEAVGEWFATINHKKRERRKREREEREREKKERERRKKEKREGEKSKRTDL